MHGLTVTTSGYGNVFGIWLSTKAPTSYEEALAFANPAFSQDLHLMLRAFGVLIMPSPYGRVYLSFEHSDTVVEEMKVAFNQAAAKLGSKFGKS
jgi:glutamate-1-semialdehyde 2,1-aminomutase